MTKTLDLHGVKHVDVERLVENFILLNEPPLTIITGNSQRMQEIVINKLIVKKVNFVRWGSGVLKVL
jgi:hypothetical protein|tara:strand:- start:606 stop:806 length:201 start_codon:yes stop_codon:yes gene_type:complete